MSRCFPYPHPGYERRKSGDLDEALINSIKKERENTKKERKKQKREKKENGKGREKARENGGVEEKKQKHEKRHKNERSKVGHKGGDHLRREASEEQFEKSSLTEEHGQPVSSHNLYDSSESTPNSHKRKKHSSPSDSSHNHGSILRIRLKQKDHEILLSKELPSNSGKTDQISQGKYEIPPRLCQEQQLYSTSGRQQQCSTSGRTSVARQQSLKQENQEILPSKELPHLNLLNTGPILKGKYGILPMLCEVQPCSTSERATVMQQGCENDPRPVEEQTCSTSGRTGVQAADIAEGPSRSSRKLKKLESQYIDLIENWAPPIIENYGTDCDDQEWLFERPSKSEREAKRFKPSNDGVCQGSSSLWPRAFYLPEADIYALPYTVPF